MVEIKNLKKAVSRILKAIKNKEKIILYGDADLDGVAAVIILEEAIKNLGSEVRAIYFPDREIEGCGISEKGLNYLTRQLFKKGAGRALLIALDCGIGNFKEVKIAKKLGFEVIIIDHHQVLDELPEAKIIVDPYQKGDKYPFKGLAAAAISFKLVELLLKTMLTENLRKNFLELVALATIADMMPREEENKIFIEEGLRSLENSWRPGIRAFFEIEGFNHYLNLNQKVSKIISLLNIRDLENNFPAPFRLLTLPSPEESKELIGKLLLKSLERKEKIEKIIKEIEELRASLASAKASAIEEEISQSKESIIFMGSPEWEFTLISPVASNLCQKYQKPAFIFKKLEKESQGTVRVPSGIDSVALMKKCSKYLLTYGGHPLASGFRIKNENLEKFKKCLLTNYESNRITNKNNKQKNS
ncbi:hypothetical protein COT20_02905 [bacterium (Candidatus Gribaldobacteria) CG08_land_8_20_14_0_20_39_15]|uniref:Single-stranded-DNA-specific exonuclease RecJ n=1 Tax=bacterium (Candidatus Gribaldobacteria) CG08_land_8_20_14_0_20_39_15 TaxID=2014273 RepID=A0A2M6XTX7_9BACT|nr:MAG: hypothetical protein COT20_02905 [bacterium (Candidatus Gribaldobacteria) CG08_land_8_20_14_0_20_39_15]